MICKYYLAVAFAALCVTTTCAQDLADDGKPMAPSPRFIDDNAVYCGSDGRCSTPLGRAAQRGAADVANQVFVGTPMKCSLPGQIVSPGTGLCFTSEKDGEPPTSYGSITNTVPGLSILDLNAPPTLMMCYMEGFNERRLCALLGDTPGCVKWLAEHPDASKDKFQ